MSAPPIDPKDQRFVWGLCYRLTGSAADADDLVQEALLRAIECPPPREGNLRAWVARVAVNLGRDRLRERRRRGYVGTWLPDPIGEDEIDVPIEAVGAEGRYDLVESVSFAFLVALEALKPRERAVLLLCDVFDYSVREVADALGLGVANVKVLHHRARKKLEAYDARRLPRTEALEARTVEAFQRFLLSIASQDQVTLESLLGDEVRALNDGGGEFFAARRPVVGRSLVARFYLGLQRKFYQESARFSFGRFNGAPAMILRQIPTEPKLAPLFVTSIALDASNRIDRIYTFLATPKLSRVDARSPLVVR